MLENENFQIFRNSALAYSENIAGTTEAKRIAIVLSIITLLTFLFKIIPNFWRWTIVAKILFFRRKKSGITLADTLITVRIDYSVS